MTARIILGAVPLVLLSGGAFAQASPEGADRLARLFQSYLGTTPGVVAVVPEGDAYTLTLDLAPLVGLLPQEGLEGLEVTSTPLAYRLEEQGGGLWRVTEDQAFTMSATVPGVTEFSLSYGSIVSEGIWDEALQSFTSYTAETGAMETRTVSYGPDGALLSDSSTRMAGSSYGFTGGPGAGGGVDGELTFSAEGYGQSMALPMAPGAPPMTIDITAETYEGNATVAGMRSGGMLDLLAFFVRTASPDAIAADQDELKTLLGEAIPLFDSVEGTVELGSLQATTPIGPIAAEAAVVDVDMAGVVAEGRFREAIRLSGVSIPPGLVPDWAAPLIPADAALDVAVTDFNLAAPAQTFIDAMDLTRSEPVDPAVSMQMLGQLLPDGAVTITLAPGSLVNDAYTVGFEGQMSAGPAAPPTGTARITADGIERVQEILGAAPPEVSGQALGMLGLAMGLSRPGEGGGVVWEIDASTPGRLLVNGTDMSAMFGMQ